MRGFEAIEHATPLDPLDVSLRLDEIAKLQDGWLDGEGLAPKRESLSKIADLFDNYFESDLPLPHLYPTLTGGIQAEWTVGNQSISLDIDVEELKGVYHALNLASGEADEHTLSLNEPGGWSDLNVRLRTIDKTLLRTPSQR